MVDKALDFNKEDEGKKVFEIEYDVTYVTKWQILAKDRDEADNIWLDKNKIKLLTEDSKDCICSYTKDYFEIGKTKKIATIKYNKEDDEVYADES